MHTEKDSLWYRALKAKYGEEGGELLGNGRRGSNWWKDICSLESGGNGIKQWWLSESPRKVIGNGEKTSFWNDPWVEGGLLRSRYHRLFL